MKMVLWIFLIVLSSIFFTEIVLRKRNQFNEERRELFRKIYFGVALFILITVLISIVLIFVYGNEDL
jgi:O-antigen/teichoic acid export membrane protein